jgi:MFS family permease
MALLAATATVTTTAVASDPMAAARRRVMLAQLLASVGLTAGAAAGGLLAVGVTGSQTLAAAPLGALVLGGALSAVPLSSLMAALGRSRGLQLGYLVGTAGAATVVAGAAAGLVWPLLVGNVLLGAGSSATMLSRYAVADLDAPERRARALGRSMLAIAVGAVLGPNLLGPAAVVADPLGLPDAAGLYVVAVLVLAAAALALGTTAHVRPTGTGAGPAAHAAARVGGTAWPAWLPVATLAVANATMVMVMAVLPVHLHRAGHGLGTVGVAVALHVTAMYSASPLLGRLLDRHGAARVAAAGAVTTATAGVLAAVGDVTDLVPALAVLVLLGLGWNTQVMAGSAMLGVGRDAEQRVRLEGRSEAVMAAAAAAGGLLLAGPLVRVGGLPLLAAATVPFELGLVVLLHRLRWST